MVMHPKTPRTLALALATASVLITPDVPAAGEAVVPPRLLAASFIEAKANKAECIVPETILATMRADQAFLGGRTIALIEGADQNFVDQWRVLTQSDLVEVSLVLAHGFASPLNAQVLIDVVEFDTSGCALSRTLLPGESWNRIVGSLAEGVSI
jgi:hypothetical protein